MNSLAIDSTGRTILAAGSDGATWLFDLATRTQIGTPLGANPNTTTAALFLGSGDAAPLALAVPNSGTPPRRSRTGTSRRASSRACLPGRPSQSDSARVAADPPEHAVCQGLSPVPAPPQLIRAPADRFSAACTAAAPSRSAPEELTARLSRTGAPAPSCAQPMSLLTPSRPPTSSTRPAASVRPSPPHRSTHRRASPRTTVRAMGSRAGGSRRNANPAFTWNPTRFLNPCVGGSSPPGGIRDSGPRQEMSDPPKSA